MTAVSKRWWGAGAGVVVTLVAAAWWFRIPSRQEPIYNGKPISYWTERFLAYTPDATDPFRRNLASAWSHFPSEVAEATGKIIEAHPRDSLLKRRYLRLLAALPLWCQQRLPNPRPDQEVRGLAIRNLVSWARQSKGGAAATRQLVRLLKNPHANIRAETANALAELDRPFLPPGQDSPPAADPSFHVQIVHALIEATHDPADLVRWNAVKALAALRPVSEEAVSALIAALPDRAVRRMAALSLAKLHRGAEQAVPVLIQELRNEFAVVPQLTFIEALANYGEEAAAAEPALRRLQEQRDPQIREAADKALKQIRPPDAKRRAEASQFGVTS